MCVDVLHVMQTSLCTPSSSCCFVGVAPVDCVTAIGLRKLRSLIALADDPYMSSDEDADDDSDATSNARDSSDEDGRVFASPQ